MKTGVDDFFASGRTVHDLLALATDKLPPTLDDGVSAQALPTIITNKRELRDVSADAIAALQAANTPPSIFLRGNMLTRFRTDHGGAPFLESYEPDSLIGRLARVADWRRETDDGEVPTNPPPSVARDLLALPGLDFPRVATVVEAPAFTADGILITSPGYYPDAQILYIGGGLRFAGSSVSADERRHRPRKAAPAR